MPRGRQLHRVPAGDEPRSAAHVRRNDGRRGRRRRRGGCAEFVGRQPSRAADVLSVRRGGLLGAPARQFHVPGQQPTESVPVLKELITRAGTASSRRAGWGTVFLGNHDQSRHGEPLRERRHRGTEPRRPDAARPAAHHARRRRTSTTATSSAWRTSASTISGLPRPDDDQLLSAARAGRRRPAGVLAAQAELSRDNARTPMQWSAGSTAGFSGGDLDRGQRPDYRTVNVAVESGTRAPCCRYVRRMIKLRKCEPTLVYGRYTLLDRANPEVFAYTRRLGARTLMVRAQLQSKGRSHGVAARVHDREDLDQRLRCIPGPGCAARAPALPGGRVGAAAERLSQGRAEEAPWFSSAPVQGPRILCCWSPRASPALILARLCAHPNKKPNGHLIGGRTLSVGTALSGSDEYSSCTVTPKRGIKRVG